MTDSEMLDGIGYAIGHEISHAFNFRGDKTDHYGRKGATVFTKGEYTLAKGEDCPFFCKSLENQCL